MPLQSGTDADSVAVAGIHESAGQLNSPGRAAPSTAGEPTGASPARGSGTEFLANFPLYPFL
ncbi:UNVERIFIED_ORG: hypothetical protein J2X79_004365 [Arthrobacter globiformis]|nr:hypothetical protein [Arthrobacter globiformis]